MDIKKNKRTIDSVINLRTGDEINADVFFEQEIGEIWKVRLELEKVIREKELPYLICYGCYQCITIRGGKTEGDSLRQLYFSHYRDSDECPIKTNSHLSKSDILRYKYNGAKESYLHKETKGLIEKFLLLNQKTKGEISFVEPEIVQKDKIDISKWRRPDLTSIFINKNLVFEVQLSTTFLSVIADREIFYKENENFILWVFKNFEIETEKQRFMQRDIFYSNNRNAFVLNDEAIEKSIINNDLVLLCHYQIPMIVNKQIIYEWKNKYVYLSDLVFDEKNYKVYFFNVESKEIEVKIELEKILNEEEIQRKSLEDEQRKNNYENKKIQREKYLEQKEESIQIEAERIRLKNERIDLLKKQNQYSEEKQRNIDENNRLFREINKDFYIRLKQNYGIYSNFKNVFLKPLNELPNELYSLFANGYELTESDKTFLNTEFKTELNNSSKLREMEIIYFLSLSTFYIKLKNPKYMFLLTKFERILFSILSFKTKKIIGYRFDNLISLAHHTLSKIEFSQIFLNSVDSFYGVEKLIKEDKKGKLINKLIEYKKILPKQNNEFDYMIKLIFPEAINNNFNIDNFVKDEDK